MQRKNGSSIPNQLVTRPFSEIEERDIDWLWRYRLARRSCSVLTGHSDVGKTWLALHVIACLSTGKELDGDPRPQKPVRSLIISAEDSAEEILKPRLEMLGADPSMVEFVDGTGNPEEPQFLQFPRDTKALENAVGEGFGFVLVDPLNSYLDSRVDSNSDAGMRSVLTPLKGVAERCNATILVVVHSGKAQYGHPLHNIIGSVAIGAAARQAIVVAAHEDRRLVRLEKNNYVAQDEKPADQYFTLNGGFHWRGEAPQDLIDAIGASASAGRPPKQMGKAVELVQRGLEEKQPVSWLEEQAEMEGISESTLKRARRDLGVSARRKNGKWWVALDEGASSNGHIDRSEDGPSTTATRPTTPDQDLGLTPSDPAKCSSCGVPLSPYRSHRCPNKETANSARK